MVRRCPALSHHVTPTPGHQPIWRRAWLHTIAQTGRLPNFKSPGLKVSCLVMKETGVVIPFQIPLQALTTTAVVERCLKGDAAPGLYTRRRCAMASRLAK